MLHVRVTGGTLCMTCMHHRSALHAMISVLYVCVAGDSPRMTGL